LQNVTKAFLYENIHCPDTLVYAVGFVLAAGATDVVLVSPGMAYPPPLSNHWVYVGSRI
jgi:hypothetical protein